MLVCHRASGGLASFDFEPAPALPRESAAGGYDGAFISMLRRYFLIALVLAFGASAVSAQSEAELKRRFEGRFVTLKIDMPATKDGVNVYPERAQPLNYSSYAARIKQAGASIRRGESVMVTKVKVKGRHVEFQLGGGGYGTFGDETPGALLHTTGKSRREKRLESELNKEADPRRRRELKEEIDHLRRERERADQLNRAVAEQTEEAQRARIERKALAGGSRFNIHFGALDAGKLTPESVIEALRRYVDFSGMDADDDDDFADESVNFIMSDSVSAEDARVVRVGPSTTYLKEGTTTDEALKLLGPPLRVSERQDEGRVIVTCVFARSAGRVLVAEFVDGRMVNSRIEKSESVASSERAL